ncbi:MAG: MerR family transcriptional regulator [Halioglobus sp.]
MQNPDLEPRPLYAIGTVARLSGVKPDTLRVWERRHGLGASLKSATGRRQYTQSDLEHLQLIAALVSSGSRIGEIASAPRKTLEVLLRDQGKAGRAAISTPKPKSLFIGEGLCDWLDEHQGCLVNVNALLARCPLGTNFSTDLDEVDALIVECTTLATSQVARINALAAKLKPKRILVMYQFCNERWLQELKGQDITAISFPPDPAYLAFELGHIATEQATGLGEGNLGQLVSAKPAQFSSAELSAARQLQSEINCECPRHISDLILALANFEEYSAECSVENWHDAAVHSCIYAYTGQARWLMEKALSAVLETRRAELTQVMQHDSASLDDAA